MITQANTIYDVSHNCDPVLLNEIHLLSPMLSCVLRVFFCVVFASAPRVFLGCPAGWGLWPIPFWVWIMT
jgi:hypothetical protein